MTTSTQPSSQDYGKSIGYKRYVGCMVLLVLLCISSIAVWKIRSLLKPCEPLDMYFERSGCEERTNISYVSVFDISGDGNVILALRHNSQKEMSIYNQVDGSLKEIRSPDGLFPGNMPGAGIEDIALTRDGKYAALVSSGNLGIVQTDVDQPEPNWLSLPISHYATQVAISVDETMMAVAITTESSGYIGLYTFPAGETLGAVQSQVENIAVAFSPQNDLVTGFGNQIQFWDVGPEVNMTNQFGSDLSVHSLYFSPDGNYLIATSGDPYVSGGMTVEVFDPSSGDQLQHFSFDTYANFGRDVAISISADSQLLAISSCDVIDIYRLSDGNHLNSFLPFPEFVGLSGSCIGSIKLTSTGNSIYYNIEKSSIVKMRVP